MNYSKDGLKLTEQFEGCRLEAYPDPATGGEPWTIGYGHTGPDVFPSLAVATCVHPVSEAAAGVLVLR